MYPVENNPEDKCGKSVDNLLLPEEKRGKDMVLRVLNALMEKNIIRKKGMARGTKYEIR